MEGFGGGLSGLFVKPFEGAKKDGAKGFFVGLGKGTIALPTKLGSCMPFPLFIIQLVW